MSDVMAKDRVVQQSLGGADGSRQLDSPVALLSRLAQFLQHNLMRRGLALA